MPRLPKFEIIQISKFQRYNSKNDSFREKKNVVFRHKKKLYAKILINKLLLTIFEN